MTDNKEGIEVAWARRQEHIRGILKMIRIMVLAVQNHADRVERLGGITAPQLWALRELDRAPGLRVVDLARAMAVHANGVRTLLAELAERGLVRELSAADSPKTARFGLTEAGLTLLASAPEPAQGVVFAALEQLDDKALVRLAEALQPLVAHMPYADGSAALKPLADLLHGHVRRPSLTLEVSP